MYEFPGLPDNLGPRPPSVNRLAGLIWLAHALPQRPFDRTFYDEMQSFFSIFYHVDLTDAQIQRLVARPESACDADDLSTNRHAPHRLKNPSLGSIQIFAIDAWKCRRSHHGSHSLPQPSVR